MPKIVYDDGREEEIELIGGGREVGEKEYFKFTKVDRSSEQLREMLTQVMQSRQVMNLLPFEIVQGMLYTMGNTEFADDLVKMVNEVREHDEHNIEDYVDYPNKAVDKFLKKWGLRI